MGTTKQQPGYLTTRGQRSKTCCHASQLDNYAERQKCKKSKDEKTKGDRERIPEATIDSTQAKPTRSSNAPNGLSPCAPTVRG
jgi:hypothetical protein